MRGIHENDACNLIRMPGSKQTGIEAADRVSDQHVRRRDLRMPQQCAQFLDLLTATAGLRGLVAPAQACAVVHERSLGPRECLEYLAPTHRGRAQEYLLDGDPAPLLDD